MCSVLNRLRGILPPPRRARILPLGLDRSQGARSILGWSAATTALMGKRYGHIGDAARRSAVTVLGSFGLESGETGHRIGHSSPGVENTGTVSH